MRKNEQARDAPDVARLISRQIRNADNKRFLRRLPGLELERDLPSQVLDLLRKLQEVEGTYSTPDMRQQDSR